MLLLYYTMNQSHTDVTMVSSSLLGRLGLVVSGAGVSVVESLALVLGVLAWLVGVAAMSLSPLIQKTSHDSTCGSLSHPLALLAPQIKVKVKKCQRQHLTWSWTCCLGCWLALGPAGEGWVAWPVLLGLCRAAGRFYCSSRLRALKLCQDSANSLNLSLSISLVIAHIGVGSKICFRSISVRYVRYLIALHWTFDIPPISWLLLATVRGVRAGLAGAPLQCSVLAGVLVAWSVLWW